MQKIGRHTWKREWVCGCKLYVAGIIRKYAREHNEMQLKLFTEYQQGTDALSNTMPETPKHNRPVASQPRTNEAKRSSKVTFFSLPPKSDFKSTTYFS